ncbi:MAG: hypothetical protein MZV49_15105 [Rhodopseudomonas palustris]|nr:hypothetical protein [Rhodopseudomonas palustris]
MRAHPRRSDQERHQGADRQRPSRCSQLKPKDYTDERFGLPTVHRHPARTGKAGPRPASGVQDRRVPGRRRGP